MFGMYNLQSCMEIFMSIILNLYINIYIYIGILHIHIHKPTSSYRISPFFILDQNIYCFTYLGSASHEYTVKTYPSVIDQLNGYSVGWVV